MAQVLADVDVLERVISAVGLHQVLDERAQLLCGTRVRRRDRLRSGNVLFGHLAHDLVEQLLLAADVVIKRRPIDPELTGNRAQARALEALLVEDPSGGVRNLAPPLLICLAAALSCPLAAPADPADFAAWSVGDRHYSDLAEGI